ncbi:hypothetical protein OSB04_000853 [Centaurea solstitialis]|uniref:Uncharacterized protein n=1 Tax=Centaurea solstitialis TaxID=347529 RepID=A0AA38WKX6_9ASTR|nr:hypothetical protein OSB04_000853 [Centaurea solstitialis]
MVDFVLSTSAPNYTFMRAATEAPKISFYDYIVVGGGPTGIPLATTLSQNYSVLLLERGGSPYGNPDITHSTNFGNYFLDPSPDSAAELFMSEDGVGNARPRVLGGVNLKIHEVNMKFHKLATDTILNSLSDDYKPFVVNYNMNNMEKSIAELHSMLKTAELNMGTKNKTKDVLMVRDGGVKKKHGHTSTSKGKGPVQAVQSAPKKGKGKGKGKKVKPNKARTENR